MANKLIKLLLVLPMACMFLIASTDAANLRQLSASNMWNMVKSVFMKEHALTSDMLHAIWNNDVNGFLNAACQKFANVDCYGNDRLLLDNTLIGENVNLLEDMDTKDLLAKYPNNRDEIAKAPFGYKSVDEWLEGQERLYMTSTADEKSSDEKVSYMKIKGFGEKGSLFVVPGQSEPCAKYDEILLDYYYAGYSMIYCIDHRGQGYSSRLLKNDEEHFKNHVVSSDHFVTDLKSFIDTIFVKETDDTKPRFLACHSMGCAITLGYLTNEYNDAKSETVFHAIAMNAPLVKANTDPFPYPVAVAIGEVMSFFGLSENYAPTKEKSFQQSYANSNFEGSTTSSLIRWTRHRDRCINFENKRIGEDEHVGLCLGGVTAGMAKEFFDLNVGLENFKGKIATPVLLQVAGDMETTDGLVMNQETVKFQEKALLNSKVTNYRASKHQIWWESDSIRSNALGEVNEFFEKYAKEAKTERCPKPATCGSWNYSWRNWGCNDSSNCSYQYKFGDYHLGMSCRPKSTSC